MKSRSNSTQFDGREFNDLAGQLDGLGCVLFPEGRGRDSAGQAVGVTRWDVEAVKKGAVCLQRGEILVVFRCSCQKFGDRVPQHQSMTTAIKISFDSFLRRLLGPELRGGISLAIGVVTGGVHVVSSLVKPAPGFLQRVSHKGRPHP